MLPRILQWNCWPNEAFSLFMLQQELPLWAKQMIKFLLCSKHCLPIKLKFQSVDGDFHLRHRCMKASKNISNLFFH